MYHVNPVTGNVGRCRARSNECPFGNTHYSEAIQAQVAYEQGQSSFLTPLRKVRTTKVYRVGAVTPPALYFDDLEKIVTFMDRHAPANRTPRRGAVFASPDLTDHARWVRGTSGQSHELTVNDDVYVYPVALYEQASSDEYAGRLEAASDRAREYWDSGMKLADWREWAKIHRPPRGSWEVLIPADAIQSTRRVSAQRILNNARDDGEREEFKAKLRRERAI